MEIPTEHPGEIVKHTHVSLGVREDAGRIWESLEDSSFLDLDLADIKFLLPGRRGQE